MLKRFSGYLNILDKKKSVKILPKTMTEEQRELASYLQRDLDNIPCEKDAKQYIKALIKLTSKLGVNASFPVNVQEQFEQNLV